MNIDWNKIPTIDSLVSEVVEMWMDERPEGSLGTWLDETVSGTVPSMTTVLFAMVVKDNSLAFLDGNVEDTVPFTVLTGGIIVEVTQSALTAIEATISEEAEEDGA